MFRLRALVFAVGLAARTEAVCTLSEPISALDGRVQIRYFANVDDGTMTVEYTHSGLSWVAFGQSAGSMVGSDVAICRPGSSGALEIGKYQIESQSPDGFTPLPQTLTDASCEQANDVTTMRFTQLLAASGEIPIVVDTQNTFCVAVGMDNTFGYHGPNNRVIITETILPCSNAVVSGAPTSPPVTTTSAPTPASVETAAPSPSAPVATTSAPSPSAPVATPSAPSPSAPVSTPSALSSAPAQPSPVYVRSPVGPSPTVAQPQASPVARPTDNGTAPSPSARPTSGSKHNTVLMAYYSGLGGVIGMWLLALLV